MVIAIARGQFIGHLEENIFFSDVTLMLTETCSCSVDPNVCQARTGGLLFVRIYAFVGVFGNFCPTISERVGWSVTLELLYHSQLATPYILHG